MEADHATHLEKGALDILLTLRQHHHEAYWAGGCVRDRLLGKPPKDFDIATSATPEQVASLFPKTVAIGKAFGVIGVLQGGHLYEVATFRKEHGYSDGRRPDRVEFTGAKEDALRRDFTINALFYDPVDDRVLDYVDGRKDLDARCVRAVGNPSERFIEDHLRMLRAVRFSCTLDYTLEPDTRRAIEKHALRIAHISQERIRDELIRIFTESVRPGDALLLLLETGLLEVILPEVAAMHGVEQPPEFHPEGDVFTHTRIMLNLMRDPTPELAFSILLHDVGKPVTARLGPGTDGKERIRFDGHDKVGAEMAETILRRLRFPNAVIDTVTHCVRNHMRFMHVQDMRRAKLRALIAAPSFETELELHRVDCLSSHGDLSNHEFLMKARDEFQEEPSLPRAWIRGEDLIALGISEGPEIGRILNEAYTQQLEGAFPDRAALLEWVSHYVREEED